MTTSELEIRPMTMQNLEKALDWAALEGWNPGLRDAVPFYAADPHGFSMGFLGEEPVSCISGVRYQDEFAFIGLYIVRPEFRGRGLGIQTWNHCLANLQDTTIGLDGVLGRQSDYERSGFQLAKRNTRFQGKGGEWSSNHEDVRPFVPEDFVAISRLDQFGFPANRDAFLAVWTATYSTYVREVRGEVSGFVTVRPCRSGYKIGPLIAEDPGTADLLLAKALSSVPTGELVSIDVPETHVLAMDLVHRNALKPIFSTVRMYRGPFPEVDESMVYGVATFELG